jgi:flavin-dependent dehydrogenase
MRVVGGTAANKTTAVVVIGGGPAGSTAARILAEGNVPTVLVEGSASDVWKVGETLPPSARATLEGLGAWERFLADDHLRAFGTCSAWGSERLKARDFLFDPYGTGWHLDRGQFDQTLRDAAASAGVECRPSTRVVGFDVVQGRGWSLDLLGPRGHTSLTSSFVVDATGRSSWFARRCGIRRTVHDRLLGVVWLLAARTGRGCEATTLVEAVERGWWYSAPVPGCRLVVACMTDADLLPRRPWTMNRLWQALGEAVHTKARVEAFGSVFQSSPRIRSAASSCLSATGGTRWVAAGDAAAAFDPLSSQGILTAMESGRDAARSLLVRLQGGRHILRGDAKATGPPYVRYLAERAAYYALEKRWPDSPFWSRRHGIRPRAAAQEANA